MAGLLIRELVMRADARRIMIVAPGSLSGQWQDGSAMAAYPTRGISRSKAALKVRPK